MCFGGYFQTSFHSDLLKFTQRIHVKLSLISESRTMMRPLAWSQCAARPWSARVRCSEH